MPRTSVCGIYVSVSSCAAIPRGLRRGVAEPKETETDMENGVKEVNTFLDGKETDDVPEPTIIGSTVKMKRGTASHKTERIDGRFDLIALVWGFNACPGLIKTYKSLFSSLLTHRAVIFNLSRTLVVDKSVYLSSVETFRMLASHHGNRDGSDGSFP